VQAFLDDEYTDHHTTGAHRSNDHVRAVVLFPQEVISSHDEGTSFRDTEAPKSPLSSIAIVKATLGSMSGASIPISLEVLKRIILMSSRMKVVFELYLKALKAAFNAVRRGSSGRFCSS
jgi:hypothetical protein